MYSACTLKAIYSHLVQLVAGMPGVCSEVPCSRGRTVQWPCRSRSAALRASSSCELSDQPAKEGRAGSTFTQSLPLSTQAGLKLVTHEEELSNS